MILNELTHIFSYNLKIASHFLEANMTRPNFLKVGSVSTSVYNIFSFDLSNDKF